MQPKSDISCSIKKQEMPNPAKRKNIFVLFYRLQLYNHFGCLFLCMVNDM